MKHDIEKKFWGFMLQEWDVSIWTVIERTLWLLVMVSITVIALRLMAWADTGSRGECPVEKSIVPDCLSPAK